MATVLRKLRIRRVALVTAGANQEADVALFKSADAREEDMAEDKDLAAKLTALEKEVADLTAAKAVADAALKKAADEKAANDELKKSAEQRATETSAAVVALEKQLKASTEQVEKMVEEREVEKYTAIAKDLPHLGKADAGAKQLRDIAKALGAEGFGEYLTSQRALAAQLEASGLLKEIGVDGDGDATSPEAIAKTAAQSIQKADPSLTWHQALAKAYETPAFKEAYNARAGKGGQ